MNKRKVPKIRFKGFYDDWEQRKLSEMGEVITGSTPSTQHPEYYSEDGIPWVTPTDITENVISDTPRKLSSLGVQVGRVVPAETILVTCIASIGKNTMLANTGSFNQQINGLVPNKQKYDPYFLLTESYHWSVKMKREAAAGTMQIVNKNEFSAIETFVPGLPEQQAIGSYFKEIDNLITLHQKKYFEWKKRDFTSVSISWEQRKLGDIATFINGRAYSQSELLPDGKYKVLRVGNFYTNDSWYYSNLELGEKYYADYGDLLYTWSATFGPHIWLGDRVIYHYHIWRIDLSDQLEKHFAVQLLEQDKANILSSKNGSTMVHITKEGMEQKDVTIPPNIVEQAAIGAFFENLDHLITLHQRKLELLKRLRNSLVNRCFIGEKCTMSKLILYHGSPNRVIVSKFGFGEDRHDYGRGFYLTENLELAKEWAVCRPDETNGWVHKYELEMDGLNILDFQKYDVLSWLAELMKHRDAADSRRYKMLAQKFIEKYGIDTCGYDVITGWRANASYFYIAKEFVRDNIDIEILEELLSLGGLGIQFCIKSERAFAQLSEVEQDIMSVDYSEFNDRYISGTTTCRAARS